MLTLTRIMFNLTRITFKKELGLIAPVQFQRELVYRIGP